MKVRVIKKRIRRYVTWFAKHKIPKAFKDRRDRNEWIDYIVTRFYDNEVAAREWIDEQLTVSGGTTRPIANGDDSYCCDVCGETVGWEELDVFGIDPVRYKYCPGCGRKVKWDDHRHMP